ncbi:MAG TPA: hypothetical protein VEX13_11490 [Chloroflexia bacterium]|nr:hypothetical protein [Chloroflexia bacterium]
MASTYEELYDQVVVYYRVERYAEALALLVDEADNFPQHAPMSLYLRACMAARTNQIDLAFNFLQQALDSGTWYSESFLCETPSFQSLQELPRFQEIVHICKQRSAEAEASSKAALLVSVPEGDPQTKYPTLVVLHGNGDNADTALINWSVALAEGWLVAAVQSSQLAMSDVYVWNDPEKAVREVQEQYARLVEKYPVDREQVLIAGFSMGGDTALRIALTGVLPVNGFVLLGPGGPTINSPEEWHTLLSNERGHSLAGLRGYIMLGELETDPSPRDMVRLVGLLNAKGLQCEVEILPGARHGYPENFASLVSRALHFVCPD